ncbi:3'-5' exoribonuclease YhaM [Brevibacillus reuszeri]|uniref:3'-5' exonuclease n=1 Tax=Brevibacillus reuszeri TaxID=54915 RepID=A0A0K9YU77_9BACL|nr:HD domain-containing protein [Brevibacillus reuszeri]KNB72202.1 3'-5' exonuclease [Brevibacillus reuszeri]MED1855835.1 HD domain-containing protein [Brevibacillus reuszeri]GED72199.1 3'-5' exoribonuclease YhaM [Brevibacillus reuszeri]
MKYLNDYTEGERVVAFCLVKNKEAGVASNQSEYLNLELGDRSGTLMAKLWDVNAEMKDAIAVKTVVKIDAVVQLYRGKKQLVIQRIRPASASDEVMMESLIPVSPVPVDELWDKLEQKISSLQSATLKAIINEALADGEIRERIRQYPAGVRMHHNYYHGLLEHIVSLLTAAERLLPLYPQVDRDVLYATCIMHDIGKLYELSDPVAPDYTTPGQLIGHLVMGVEIVSSICRKLDIPMGDAEVLHLKHCILSHHGEVENGWGSAVSGKTPTAVLFHYLDQIDSKMNALGQTLADMGEDDEWAYAGVLKRKVWRGY